MNKDIRWEQRLQNFGNALRRLEDAVKLLSPSELEKIGTIQVYEFTFELAWKTLKDFLEFKQVPASFPRDVIKEAFKHDLIDNGDVWMDMLEKRNLMSHTYDEEKAELAYNLIREIYIIPLRQVYMILKNE